MLTKKEVHTFIVPVFRSAKIIKRQHERRPVLSYEISHHQKERRLALFPLENVFGLRIPVPMEVQSPWPVGCVTSLLVKNKKITFFRWTAVYDDECATYLRCCSFKRQGGGSAEKETNLP